MKLSCLLPLFSLFLVTGLSAQNRLSREIQIRKTIADIHQFNVVKEKIDRKVAKALGIHVDGDASFFKVNKDAVASLIDEQPELLTLEIPYGQDGRSVQVLLYNKKPYTNSAIVTTNTGDKYPMNKAAFYRGIVAGQENSLAAISFFDGEMSGVISCQEGQFDIGKVDKKDIHVIFQSNTLSYKYNFNCGVIDDDSVDDAEPSLDVRNANDCVNIFFETSYSIYQNKGSVSAVQNYVTGFFNVVTTLYDNESVNVAISEIYVWTSQDPFPTNSSNSALNYYTDYRTDFNGDIAQLLAKTSNGNGGIAWLDVLCNTSTKHSYSDISMNYSGYPTYSWTVMVVTHELGHNIGSRHTHWCGWQGGAIDNCYQVEGNCSPGPPPTNGGTIMSYCHLTNYGINFSNGFGQQPGNKIRQEVQQASCLSSCSNQCPTFVLNGTVTNVSCNGGGNGSISVVEPTEGTSPYTYTWSNGATTKDISNLIPGDYTLSITDALGCPGQATFTVTEPTAIEIQGQSYDASCYGSSNGSIIITVNGGTPGYSYNWSNGNTAPSLVNIPAGNYFLTVTDSKFCTKTENYYVGQPSQLLISSTISNISCFGANDGIISVGAYGGTPLYSYQWNNNSNESQLIQLGPGTYTVTVTDDHSCQVSGSYTITEPSQLTGQVVTTDASSNNAADGTAEANMNGATPPYSYLWSNGQTSKKIVNLPVGNYSVTVSDANGCQLVLYCSIGAPDCTLQLQSDKTDISCFGANDGTALANASNPNGSVNYLWSNGATSQTITNLAPGTYSVTVSDNICQKVSSVEVVSPGPINIIPTLINPACDDNNGSISINVNGGTAGYTYLWSNGATTQNISALNAGNYTVTVLDAHNCSSQQSFTLTAQDNQAPTLLNDKITLYLDTNGNAELTTIPTSYLFEDNCGTVSVVFQNTSFDCDKLGKNNITATGTDEAGNSIQVNLEITVIDSIKPFIQCPSDFTIGICQGAPVWDDIIYSDNCQVVTIQQTAGYAPGTIFPIGVTEVAYQVTDLSGNQNSCSFSIHVAEGLALNVSKTDMACNNVANGSATLDTKGFVEPYTILWSTGANTPSITNLGPGDYSVTVTDGNGCVATQTVTIINPAPLEMEVVSVTQASSETAADGAISISVSGGTPAYSFSWTKNGEFISSDQNPSGLTHGVYKVEIKDKNGCVIIGAQITVGFKLGNSNWDKGTVLVYPNPADQRLVVASASMEDSMLEIYDILGRKIDLDYSKGFDKIFVNTESLSNGSYILRLESGNQWYVTKFVIIH